MKKGLFFFFYLAYNGESEKEEETDMNLWLRSIDKTELEKCGTPAEVAACELQSVFQEARIELENCPELGDGYRVSKTEGGYHLCGGDRGLLYGAYALIRRSLCGEEIPAEFSSSPRYGLRMINCWDNMDGSVERGYAGKSLFFRDGKFRYDPDRIRTIGRLMASVGLNVICINNVNVHDPAQRLIEDMLPELAGLAGLLRPYGVKLMVSVDFSQPMRHGIPTADPLDARVRAWWAETAKHVYALIPDLAGFLVKADSEGRPGPFTYGRNHAEGANMLAEALAPYGGKLVWRCFVYNCRQDWRDTTTDRPKAAWEHYAYLDGQFAENVILQIKHGPFDFQVREPLSPLLLGLKKTAVALELQLAQEYTGQQIDLYGMAPMWREVFEEMPADRIMAMAAVSNWGDDENYTGNPLAAFNWFGYGLLAWDPMTPAEEMARQWVRLTWGFGEAEERRLCEALLGSRRIYEKYTAPLGLGWMITPHTHYGPNPSGYEYDAWGTYHKASRDAVGIDRTAKGTGYLTQYPEELQRKYGDPATCPDLLLLFFHRLPYTYEMRDGRTVIQRIYDDHFEGAEEAEALAETLKALPFPEPDGTVIRERAERQVKNAHEWRDVINTFFHRLSGIPDKYGRKIYE